MRFDNIHNVYFLGIGGIGMSALARYFNQLGKNIAGYDRTQTDITLALSNEGMNIHFEDNLEKIENSFKNKADTLIIYTPAIPQTNSEWIFFKNNGFKLYKRAEILGLISREKDTIAIAGTHGKTSISTLTSHILQQSVEKCNSFLGGISKNYQSNYLFSSKSKRVVIEADEFDRSFLQLNPQIALISSMDADHLDIYGNRNELVNSFNQFISQINNNGYLIFNKQIESEVKINDKITGYSYSINKDADFYAEDIQIKNNKFCFNIVTPFKTIRNIELGLPGRLNIENAIGASAVAIILGIQEDMIKQALSSFKGVIRRFDYQVNTDKLIYIDDYGHHPRELAYTIKSVKELYPDKKITGIFQPHLYTRTRDFAAEFAQSLDMLDEIVLMDIYPAREEPIPGVTSEIIFTEIKNQNKVLCSKQELLKIIENRNLEVLLTMGAGDIDQFVKPIKETLNKRL